MSTLDHLTNGRIGWNIVTGYLDSAARGMGWREQPEHDSRYDVADEYMQVVYKLWEGSWEDDAVLRDRERRLYADPARIHRVQHEGRHYKVDAIHLSEPSPQRTPVLYQAGRLGARAGIRGERTRSACSSTASPPQRARHVADIRAQREACGPRSGRREVLHRRHRRRRADRARGAGQARRVPPLRQLGGRAGAFLGLARHRLLALRSRRADPLRQTNAHALQLEAITVRSRGSDGPCATSADDGARQPPDADRRLARRSPTSCRPGWRRPTSTASTSPARDARCVEDFVALVVPELQRAASTSRLRAGHAAREAVRSGGPAAASHPAARCRW